MAEKVRPALRREVFILQIRILCVGKVKEKFYRDAAGEYIKRLGRYARVEIVETADEKTPDHAKGAACDGVRKKEGVRLLEKIRDRDYVIALDMRGESMDSVAFADRIAERMNRGASSLDFIIGGSLGLDDEVLQRADAVISFSKMTFPHQLMRVILLEQIYRAFRIMNREPYHK